MEPFVPGGGIVAESMFERFREGTGVVVTEVGTKGQGAGEGKDEGTKGTGGGLATTAGGGSCGVWWWFGGGGGGVGDDRRGQEGLVDGGL